MLDNVIVYRAKIRKMNNDIITKVKKKKKNTYIIAHCFAVRTEFEAMYVFFEFTLCTQLVNYLQTSNTCIIINELIYVVSGIFNSACSR